MQTFNTPNGKQYSILAREYEGIYYKELPNILIEEFPDSYGGYRARKDGLWGYLDENFDTLINFQYQNIGNCAENKITAVKNDKMGLIDLNNNVILDFNFDLIMNEENSLIYAFPVYTTYFPQEGSIEGAETFLNFQVYTRSGEIIYSFDYLIFLESFSKAYSECSKNTYPIFLKETAEIVLFDTSNKWKYEKNKFIKSDVPKKCYILTWSENTPYEIVSIEGLVSQAEPSKAG